MIKKTYYSDGTELMIGDVVKFKVLFFFSTKGQIVYIPFASKKHPEMEIQGLHFVGMRLEDGAMSKATVDPKTNVAIGLKFLKRGKIKDENKVQPQDRLFEDEEGNPL